MPLRNAKHAPLFLALSLAVAFQTGCGRPLRGVELAPLSFSSPLPPIAGGVEACIDKPLRARHWNVETHPYRVELGKRAALGFERMVKASFREVVVDYSDVCGHGGERPWIQARILAANRDWDGVDGLVDSAPVDTAMTMQFEFHAPSGETVWEKRVEASHRTPGFIGTRVTRAVRGSEDFGFVLARALEQGHAALVAAPEVRAFYDDASLEPDADTTDATGAEDVEDAAVSPTP